MARRRRDQGDEAPHDVLAAEEFPPPAEPDAETPEARAHRLPPDATGDPEHPHDVLAAEEFPPPAHADADTVEARAHRLPPDLTGDPEHPHDVLAAEEFPPPAHADVASGASRDEPRGLWRLIALGFAGGLAVALLIRRLRS